MTDSPHERGLVVPFRLQRVANDVQPVDLSEDPNFQPNVDAMLAEIARQIEPISDFDKGLVVAHVASIILADLCGGPMAAMALFADVIATNFEDDDPDDPDGGPELPVAA